MVLPVYICPAFWPDTTDFSNHWMSYMLLSLTTELQIPSNWPALKIEPRAVVVSEDLSHGPH